MEIQGKTIVITGAARGLGAAMAKRLAPHKPLLALVDLKADDLKAAAAACEQLGATVHCFGANVAREADAGITRDALLIKYKDGKVESKMTLDQWQAVMDVNLTGVFLCGREAAERMITGKVPGVIINISSISRAGNAGQTNYSAAKAGVAAMAVTWAKELARYGIRAASIAPGFINTEMVAGMKPEAREKLTSGIPLKRMGEPDEIAQTVEFILQNDYVSGRCFEIDGALRL
jgi:3-oxoacyl-[acyl-carrier protein] reductase